MRFLNKKYLYMVLFLLTGKPILYAQQNVSQAEKMEWFEDAKLGIFIHWGAYAVEGVSESWAFFNNYMNHENYMKQLEQFSASSYNPQQWVDLIESSGAQYAVMTAKHHDGISLWDSQAEQAITTVHQAAAKKDLLSPFIQALKKTALKTGIYYSLPDWSHPYYDIHTRIKTRYQLADDPQRWDKYIQYYQQQLEELSTQYRPDLIWFDGDWEHSAEEWKSDQTLALLQKYNPQIIINSRLNHYGDYETPEQGIPVLRPQSRYWELCYTINDSWGYQPFDTHYKTPNMIVRTLVDCISMGGNLLLDIGPQADGRIPEPQVEVLKTLGRWTSKHQEAVYGTRAGLPFSNYKGKSALAKDGKTLYLYIDTEQKYLMLEGLHGLAQKAYVVGDSSSQLLMHSEGSRITLDLAQVSYDPHVTVIAVQFDTALTWEEPKVEQTELSAIVAQQHTHLAITDLIHQLHKGHNILNQAGLTADGLGLGGALAEIPNADLKSWISKHAEALFETSTGLPDGHYAGYSALSADRQTLYLFVDGEPTGPIALKGIKNTIARIRIVGEGSMIGHDIFNKLYWSPIPGIIYIDIPKARLDQQRTVIAVLLDKPIDLYREEVGAIESNL